MQTEKQICCASSSFLDTFLQYLPGTADIRRVDQGPNPTILTSLLIPMKEMVSPYLSISQSILILTGRLWFGRRTMIFGMACPWIGLWMVLWGKGLGYLGCHEGRVSERENISTPKVKRQEGASESAKLPLIMATV
jgi:hypothetical protein